MVRQNGRGSDKEMEEKKGVSLLERTAYHEAGHAVMAYLLRHATKAVSIIPNHSDNSLGHREGHKTTMQPDIGLSGKNKNRLEEKIMINLAGGIAAKILTGRRDHAGSSGDYQSAVQYVSYISLERKEQEALLKWLCIRTENYLKYDWKAVEFLAAELLKRKKIKGKELETVMRDAFGHGIYTEADRHLAESLQALEGGSSHGKTKRKG